MSKTRDRDKKVAIACGLGVVVIAGLIVLSWDGLRAWHLGYRFIWLPEGVVPLQHGRSINASGDVAVKLDQGPKRRQVGLWSLATRKVLPLAGTTAPFVLATNDAGEILGGNVVTSFLWKKDAGVQDFVSRGERTVAIDINERGQVVGWSTIPSSNVSRAFLWTAESGIVDLGSLAAEKESLATAINEAGWVVGWATIANGSRHPFLWKPETGMQDLGLPSGSSAGTAQDINDQGEVLVTCTSTIGLLPFVWREKDGLVALPAPPGFIDVSGVALNNRGTVLLEASPSEPALESAGYLIINGVLKELPNAPGAESTIYYGLNDKGWLVGAMWSNEDGGPRRGFVALPVR